VRNVTSLTRDKVKRAVHLLLFKRGRTPGVKEWELKEKLGENYKTILLHLNEALAPLGLEIVKVLDSSEKPGGFRYLVRSRDPLTAGEAKLCGWRMDNLAALAASIAFIASNGGESPRRNVEKLLSEKFGRWRSTTLLNSFVRLGYLTEDDRGILSLGWRAKAEVDLKALIKRLVNTPLK